MYAKSICYQALWYILKAKVENSAIFTLLLWSNQKQENNIAGRSELNKHSTVRAVFLLPDNTSSAILTTADNLPPQTVCLFHITTNCLKTQFNEEEQPKLEEGWNPCRRRTECKFVFVERKLNLRVMPNC